MVDKETTICYIVDIKIRENTMKKIIIIYLVIGLIFSLIANFGMDSDIDKLKATNQNYSYCIKSETSIEIINLDFYYNGKDKSTLTYFLEGENCSYFGLSTFRKGYPLKVEGTDYGCKLKNDMLEKCENANKKAQE